MIAIARQRTQFPTNKRAKIDLRSLPDKEMVLKILAEKSLSAFIKQAWHVLEPSTPYVHGWHIDYICEHLEAVSRGEIKRLIINVPPRHMKSLAVSVFWGAWEWINNPGKKMLYSSYASELSLRDGQKTCRLILSNWYQDRWSASFSLIRSTSFKLENDKLGYRIATSVEGMATGEGGDVLIVDDPHHAKDISSVVKRTRVLLWWDEVMSSRLNDLKAGAKVVIMQRLHERDLSGHILSEEKDYVHLCLPAEYEGENKIRTVLPLRDPRTEMGQLLWEEKCGRIEIDKLKKELGTYAVAGQLQQRPAPRGGGLFLVDKIKILKGINKAEIQEAVRYWDKAGTEGGGCYSAGALMYRMEDGTFVLGDMIRGQWSAKKREDMIKQTANIDGEEVEQWIEQEPGSGGLESAENTIRNLSGYRIYKDKVRESKEARAEGMAIQVENGNVGMLMKEWNSEVLDELETFPMGAFRDMVDAMVGAFRKLAVIEKRAGVWGSVEAN